jgi:transcriptional regulator with XRE-family HTH domain
MAEDSSSAPPPRRRGRPRRDEQRPQSEDRGVHPTDAHVGRRLRLRRTLLKISQNELASTLGLTNQQIQKYENGSNKISASRLHTLAEILSVQVQFFFDDMPKSADPGDGVVEEPGVPQSDRTPEGARLRYAFSRITDLPTRRHLTELVETIADKD